MKIMKRKRDFEILKTLEEKKTYEIWKFGMKRIHRNSKKILNIEIQTFLNNIPSILFLFLERIPGHNLTEINISVRNITLTIILYQ